MSVWTALILGLLAGWLIEWVIDWIYWRRSQPQLPVAAPPPNLAARVGARSDGEARLAKANADLQGARGAISKLQGELKDATELARRHKADLDALQARLDSELASRSAGDSARTLTSGVLGGSSSMPTVRLSDAGDDENAQLRAELEAMRGELARVKVLHADRLIDINGIGPVYERRLHDAGIYTFAELAAANPERLREIIGPEGWQNIDPAAWIAESQQFADRARGGRRPA